MSGAHPQVAERPRRSEQEAFDAVIVGGGAAGCVGAARLSGVGVAVGLACRDRPYLRANPPDALRDGRHLAQQFDWGYAAEPDARGVVKDRRRASSSAAPRG